MPPNSSLTLHNAPRSLLVSLRQPFWKFFEEVSSIPRASKHEAAVLAYVKGFAKDRGLPWREDDYGNVVIDREGMNGGEDAAKVVIQGTRALLPTVELAFEAHALVGVAGSCSNLP